jgi:hypothetical protein
MGNTDKAPECVTVEFLHASGEPVRLGDLGGAFLTANRIDPTVGAIPFRVAVAKKRSHAGNAFYDYAQNGIPFPDGLSTFVRVEGAVIPLGRIRPSQKGYPTREGTAQVVVGGMLYTVTAYLTESRSPFFVKVIAHKTPDRKGNISKAQFAPRGGHIIT